MHFLIDIIQTNQRQ